MDTIQKIIFCKCLNRAPEFFGKFLFKLCPWIQACKLLLAVIKELSIEVQLFLAHLLLHPAEYHTNMVQWCQQWVGQRQETRLLLLIVGVLARSQSSGERGVPWVDDDHLQPRAKGKKQGKKMRKLKKGAN